MPLLKCGMIALAEVSVCDREESRRTSGVLATNRRPRCIPYMYVPTYLPSHLCIPYTLTTPLRAAIVRSPISSRCTGFLHAPSDK